MSWNSWVYNRSWWHHLQDRKDFKEVPIHSKVPLVKIPSSCLPKRQILVIFITTSAEVPLLGHITHRILNYISPQKHYVWSMCLIFYHKVYIPIDLLAWKCFFHEEKVCTKSLLDISLQTEVRGEGGRSLPPNPLSISSPTGLFIWILSISPIGMYYERKI